MKKILERKREREREREEERFNLINVGRGDVYDGRYGTNPYCRRYRPIFIIIFSRRSSVEQTFENAVTTSHFWIRFVTTTFRIFLYYGNNIRAKIHNQWNQIRKTFPFLFIRFVYAMQFYEVKSLEGFTYVVMGSSFSDGFEYRI